MSQKNIRKRILLVISVMIIVCVIAVFVLMKIKAERKENPEAIGSAVGNIPGNISNMGYSVQKGEFIYYVAPGETLENMNIYRTQKDSFEAELIFTGGHEIRSLNVFGNQLYFVNLVSEIAENETQEIKLDNKIYKMNLDGSSASIINDNEFSEKYFNLYIVKNEIYYVGTDENVYKMDKNGENRKLVIKTGTGMLGMQEKYLIYNQEENGNYITYIRDLETSQEKAITGSEIFSPIIYGEDIYYTNANQNIAKISMNSGKEQILYQGMAYCMNLYDNNIYYLEDISLEQEENEASACIYKLNINGGEPILIKELAYYTTFINLVNEHVFYMNINEEKAFISLININDLSEINFFEWDYPALEEDE